jgi:hypothetical protein
VSGSAGGRVREGLPVVVQVVTYQVGDTRVRFVVEPHEGFHPAGGGQVIAKVREAVEL